MIENGPDRSGGSIWAVDPGDPGPAVTEQGRPSIPLPRSAPDNSTVADRHGAIGLGQVPVAATMSPALRPAPTTGVSPSNTPHMLIENRLRGQVVDRLTLMAVRHCQHMGELQGSRRAVSHHALGFFYASESPGSLSPITAATRLLFDAEENSDLFWVLDTLIERATEYASDAFDPRIHICNRVEAMPPNASLVGIGVTTVFEPSASASDAYYASLGMDRPYQAVARMLDGTDLLLRCSGGFLAPVDVRATQTLNVGGRQVRHWEWLPQQLLSGGEAQLPEILPRLSTLLDAALGRLASSPDSVATEIQRAGGRRRRGGPRRVSGLRLPSSRRG